MAKVSFIGLGIMGSGMVGNLVKAGHEVTVWNRSDSKYAAIEKVGAKTVSDPTQLLAGADFLMYCLADDVAVDALFLKGPGPDIRDRVKSAFLGGVDFSIAAYGSEEVNQDALDVLNTRGKICLFASAHPVTPFAIDPNLMHNRETSAVGVVSADRRDHAVATDLIATGQIDLSPIVDATFPLVEAAAAFERATSSPSYRVMLHP